MTKNQSALPFIILLSLFILEYYACGSHSRTLSAQKKDAYIQLCEKAKKEYKHTPDCSSYKKDGQAFLWVMSKREDVHSCSDLKESSSAKEISNQALKSYERNFCFYELEKRFPEAVERANAQLKEDEKNITTESKILTVVLGVLLLSIFGRLIFKK